MGSTKADFLLDSPLLCPSASTGYLCMHIRVGNRGFPSLDRYAAVVYLGVGLLKSLM